MSNINDSNSPWHNEQAPFAGAETPVEISEATAVASVPPAASTSYEENAYSEPLPPPSGAIPGPAYTTGGAASSGAPNWVPSGGPYATPPPPIGPAGVVGSPSAPNPTLAFILGLIPGVGAMYNGQVAKGIVHLIVFAVLVTLANDVNGIFGIFIAGWIAFQGFEAFHTAKARRDGLPLPNAFGWNDIGERVGLGKNWPFGAPTPVTTNPMPPSTQVPGTAPAGWASAASVPPVAPVAYGNVAPNWVGYVPPTAFASTPPVGAGGYAAVAGYAPGYVPPSYVPPSYVPPTQPLPYADVNAGARYTPYVPGVVPASSSRLPVGAIWLIGLGVLFLLGQWLPMLDFGRVWIPSIVLAGLAVLLFARRMGWTGAAAWQVNGLSMEARIASAIRVPGILLTVAILNGLHEAWIIRWYRSWPVLLIVIGILMLAERMVLRHAATLDTSNSSNSPIGSDTTRAGGL